MTQTSRNGSSSSSAVSPQELRAEVEHARDELAETVSQLAAKADLKSRARERAQETRERLRKRQGPAGTGGGNQGAMAAAGAGALALVALAALLYRRRRT